ncbi:hypothetical protein LO772_01560 [Yinghuangia sp. ASG 101]|uniref:hypothetical protein n=1 Tax=Yinghuangia sp. ASG 101 TaxID=2896848 RepID=UPI001E2B6476|nr:hypothetical protein [Yinghuangia sp. ASG 101]UGQ12326.1 hypothetical protein LO772_01560 [Yinghuangia sp. ASG 101]
MGIKEDLAAAESQPNCSAAQMEAYGRIWRVYVGLAADSGGGGDRQLVIDSLNKALEAVGLKANRGFQAYDPTVRSGTPKKYTTLIATITADNDGGAGQAAAILAWTAGTTGIGSLSAAAKDFAVITHFAEVGRGYMNALNELKGLLRSIADAKPASAARAAWESLASTWTPATTYAQDVKTDFVPDPTDDYDIEESDD